jgi:AraC-like DNA-binding protein
MRKRITLTATLLLLATSFCHARALTLAEADAIIIILLLIVILLLVLGGFGLYFNRVIRRRNEQLIRILNALDDYRAIVGDGALSLDELEEAIKQSQPKPKTTAKTVPMDDGQAFFVKMDARVNKEKPFTDPNFNQQALAEFMEVDLETFRKLVPRYKDPDRTLDYINSLRAEYAAKILMDHSDYSVDEMVSKCGFKDAAAYISTFKFAFGITPTEYLRGISQMFKKKSLSK